MLNLRAKIREYLIQRLDVPNIPNALSRLSQSGFQPQIIFDVGAYRGDFARSCLTVWPQSQIFCCEALPTKIQELKQLSSQNSNIHVVPGLVGSCYQSQVPLHEVETASSVLVEHINHDFPVNYYPMYPIDTLVKREANGLKLDFLKIDVQGYELEVLKGAEQTLPHLQAILAEINLLDIHQNTPLLAEMIEWLHQRGWVAFDICGMTRRPLDKALWQADFIFVPKESVLRADKRYAKA